MQSKPSRTTFRDRLEEMVHSLRTEIVTGKWQGGDFLPSIQQLGKQYALSINSVQKGLDQLVAESLIERLPRIGIRIKERTEHAVITITIGYYPSLDSDAEFASLIKQFQIKYPHIHVQTIPLQYENYYETTSYYLNNEIVDVLAINQINFQQYVEQNHDLGEIFEPVFAADCIYPYLPSLFQQSNQLYAQPFIFSPVILCYNKKQLQEQQMPEPSHDWTWAQFMVFIHELERKDPTKLAFYFYPATNNRWPIFLLQSGINFQNDKSERADFSDSAVIDSIQTCYDLIHRHNLFSNLLMSENDINVEQLFAEQKVSIMMTTYFNLNKMQHIDFPFDIAPLPYVHTPRTLLLSIGFAANRKSKQKEAAKAFISFMASYEVMLHVRQRTYSIPAHMQAAEWEGEERAYRPQQFELYRQISHTFASLSDLHLKQDESKQLLNIMNRYWMGIEEKETLIARLKNDLGVY